MAGPPPLLLLREGHPEDAALDLAITHALLRRVASGELPAVARVYRPGATMAFGRLDTLRDGFGAAREAAAAHGYAPVVRLGGGHAAGYDEAAVVVDLVTPGAAIAEGIADRFTSGALLLAEALRAAGIDADVGELAGEYCNGRWSVHAGGIKLVGTAQRVIRGAALFTAVAVVGHGDRLRAALTDVYGALGLDWEPRTAGAADDLVAGLAAGAVEEAVVAALARRHRPLQPGTVDAPTLALAETLRAAHA
jgi:octanoyl-[GcvH]:protein N-octanoyltransferase